MRTVAPSMNYFGLVIRVFTYGWIQHRRNPVVFSLPAWLRTTWWWMFIVRFSRGILMYKNQKQTVRVRFQQYPAKTSVWFVFGDKLTFNQQVTAPRVREGTYNCLAMLRPTTPNIWVCFRYTMFVCGSFYWLHIHLTGKYNLPKLGMRSHQLITTIF